MKNIILTILLVIAQSTQAFTQSKNIYLDAIQLSELKKQYCCSGFPDGTRPKLIALLAKYGLSLEQMDNPFISIGDFTVVNSTIVDKTNQIPLDNSGNIQQKNFNPFTLSNVTSNPMLDFQSSAIQGLANFMANRFKQEAMQVGIQKVFKRILAEDQEAQLVKIIFPKTVIYISDLYGNSNASYYSPDILMIKNFALQDIQNLPFNMLEKPELVFPNLDSIPNQLALLKTAKNILQASEKQLKPAKLIEAIAKFDIGERGKIKDILNLLNQLSAASLNTEDMENPWIDMDLLKVQAEDIKEKEQLRFFYALIYQELKINSILSDYFKSLASQPEKIKTEITQLLQFTNELNHTYSTLKSIDFRINTVDDKMQYVRGINSSIKSLITSLNTMTIKQEFKIPTKYFNSTESFFAISEAILNKKYADAYPLFIVGFSEYMHKSRTLSLLFEMSNLKSASDFESTLNSYALPIGSSSIKRRSKTNLSLNGYVGLSAGHEIAYGTTTNIATSTFALSAPIGLSLTSFGGSITTFLSIIDLGSVVNKSLGDEDGGESKLRVEQFFSPGIGFFYNFRNLPLSAGFNYNYVPHLRNISYTQNGTQVTEINRNISRISFSVLVDIPFFTLHHKDK